jgi:lysophospholipase L1-like esterase
MKPFAGRRTLPGVGAAALLAATVACSSERDAVTAPPFGESTVPTAPASDRVTADGIRSVAMVGDSITVGSEPALEDAFESLGLEDFDIDAENGRRITDDDSDIDSGVGAVATLARRDPPDLWVIALGTNDVANYASDEYAAVIAELLATIPADAPIVWVDIYVDGF